MSLSSPLPLATCARTPFRCAVRFPIAGAHAAGDATPFAPAGAHHLGIDS
jgi:hypothetical protein